MQKLILASNLAVLVVAVFALLAAQEAASNAADAYYQADEAASYAIEAAGNAVNAEHAAEDAATAANKCSFRR